MILEQTGENELTLRIGPQDGRLLANALVVAVGVLVKNKDAVVEAIREIDAITDGNLHDAYKYYKEAGIALAEAGIAAGWDDGRD